MTQRAWILEGVPVGDGDEVADSVAARIISLQSGQATDTLEVAKIDNAPVDGLLGVSNSLAYKVHEIERHFHNRERWRGKLAVQTATDWADDSLSPFQAIPGNNAYGSDPNDEAQVLGTADTPIIAGSVYYDCHEILVIDASSSTTSKLRVVYGLGTMADAIVAGQFTEIMFHLDTIAGQEPHAPVRLMLPRLQCGVDKIWLQHWNATNNATIDFFVGIHEYVG